MFSILFSLFLNMGHANEVQFFTYQHSTCEAVVFLETSDFSSSDISTMRDKIKSTTKRKGFEVSFAGDNSNHQIPSNNLYFEIDMKRSGTIYKHCLVEVELKEPRGNRRTSSDRRIHGGEANRQFPRVTFKGNERCTRAIDDAFIHIPFCRN